MRVLPLRVVHRNALVYRHTWRGSLFGSFLQPSLFMLSMGLGVGGLVDRGGSALPGGVGFLAFLAPGLLAGACMQTGAFESSWAILGKMTWQRNYEAITATPATTRDIVVGELTWLALRLTTVAIAFMIVMTAFGVPRSPTAIFAIPAAVLTGVSCAAPIMAYAATLTGGNDFNVIFRFVITPMFLFSGVFFPIEQLPVLMRAAAMALPLYHGVALTRAFTLNAVDPPAIAVHLAYLLALLAIGIAAAFRTFRRKLYV
ncbi:MAG TPA: ABC transporter permease [Vicinamibacterales bacterium]|nr:ABC transporter permease [Vicinamibacterales bacterium]